jgi:hypothetical protein
MNMPLRFELPEQKLSPADDHEWTNRDLKQAEENLAYRILYEDEKWDENVEGWRGDLFVTWEATMLQYMQGKIDRDEAMSDMRIAFENHVERYAQDEVQRDPNKYCEAD